jgi:Ca2+-binding RTX toxin-like protein
MTSAINLSTLNNTNGFKIDGVAIDGNLGSAAGSAGDLNNDGINDLILGADGADPNGIENAGETYVIFGNSNGFPLNFELSDLNGSNGFTINGINVNDRSGLPASTAGDINGDNIDDIIISARNADPNDITSAGVAYIIFGNSNGFPLNFELSDLNGSDGFTINGIAEGDVLGFSLSDAGDINNDGIGDIILGAAFAERNGVENAGEAYVIFGSVEFPNTINVSELNGVNGFTLKDSSLGLGSRLGNAVNDLGDINGDGIDDIIVTAAFSDFNSIENAGISYILFGRDTEFEENLELSELDGSNGFIVNGLAVQDTIGRSAAGAGDINDDGLNDIIIGVSRGDPDGIEDAGQAYVIFGSNTEFPAIFDPSLIDGNNGFVINGINAGDIAGASVSSAGDFNGDGIDDILIGAPEASPDGINSTGEGYVVFGSSEGFAASIELSQLNGENGFVINGANTGDSLGRSVNSVGDINNDGLDDIFIGASEADPNGIEGAGTSYILLGSSSGFAPEAMDDVAIIPFNSATTIDILDNDTDPDNDPLTITEVTLPTNGTATIDDNATPNDPNDDWVVYTPDLGFTGLDSFTYTIDDGSGKSDTAIVTVTVNTPPNAVEETDTTSPATPITINILENDTDPDNSPEPITLIAVSQPVNGTATINDNATPNDPSDDSVVYTPNQGFAAQDTFTYTISDGLDTAIATVTVEVIPGIPNALDDTAETLLNTSIAINVLANDTDPENDPLTLTEVTQPENGTATIDDNGTPDDQSDDLVFYTPNSGFSGEDLFSYTVDDGNGGINTANVAVTVIVIPNISLIVEGTPTEEEETAATFTLNLSDPTSSPLTVNLNLTGTTATNPDDFTLIPGSNIIEFTPNSLLLDTGISTATLTIQPIDDVLFDPGETVAINLLPGVGYTLNEIENTANLIITDNDEANIEITPTSGLITTEDEQTASFNLVLTSQPTADVSLELINNDPSEGTLSTSSIIFTPDNWDIPQTVIITGEADVIVDGDILYTISTSPTISNDPNYNNINPEEITVTNLDLTEPTVIVNPTAGLITTEAGGTATFNVVLGSQPAADVVLPFISNNTNEGTVFPEAITFTPTNWFTPQTIRITGVNDPVDDGDINYQILTQPTISEDINYNGINPENVTVTNEDNNTANIRVTPTTGLITTERGETADFEVVLTSQPIGDVTVNLRSDNSNEGIPSINAVTFTPENWNTRQIITVTGVNDNVIDDNIAYTIITDPAISNDANYNGLNAEDINLTNIDLSEPFIVINPTTGLMTRETGSSDSFNIVLNTQPSNIVTLNLSSNDTTEGVISPEVINFTPDNWNLPQTVTITGVDDEVVDRNTNYTIITDAAISNDVNYNNLNPADILVTNRDNDLPVVNLSVTPTTATEADTTTVTVTATTSAEVNGDQTISLNVIGDEITGSDFTLSNSQITIPNGTTTGSAIFTILDDNFTEGNETAILELFNPSAGIQLGNTTTNITIIDNDILPIVGFSQPTYLITEDGFAIGENIGLNRTGDLSQPSTVEVQLVDDTAISNFDFDPNPIVVNFAVNQETAIVNPIIFDDDEVEFEESLQLQLNPIENAEIDNQNTSSITILDNEQAEILISETNLLTTEAGLTDTYTLVLTKKPLAPVTITFETEDQLQSIPEIVFDSTNWNSPQTITVAAIDDLIIDNQQTAIIRHTVSSNDDSYNNFNLTDITVAIGDNEIADIILNPTNFSISEADETQQYSVVLSSIPTAPVTITFETDNQLNPISDITFDSSNWNQPQVVNFLAINDEIIQGDRLTTITPIINSEDQNYNGLLIDPIDVTIIDDEIDEPLADIILNPINLNLSEDGIQGSYEVSLNTEPVAPVTLAFLTDNQINSIPEITFNANNFNQSQIINITAIDDEIIEGNHNSTIITNISSEDSRFNNLEIPPLTVTIADNDMITPPPIASVLISQTQGNTSVKEAEFTDTYNIVLTSQPTADVILNITPDNQTDLGNESNNPIQLLFTPENWNIPQTVTVTATDDTVVEGNHSSTINHNLTSLDPNYNSQTPILIDGVNSSNLTVEIIDNDDLGNLTFIQPLGETDVIEGYGQDIYKVALTSQPIADVIINIAENTQAITNQSTLIFTPENWNISQIVSLEATNDILTEGQHQTTLVHTMSSPDNRFNNLTFPLTINISDNDHFGETYTDINQPVHSGTLQDDIAIGSIANNIFYGNGGNDQLSGLEGEDLLLGQAGDDVIIGGSENDVISGGKGNDYLLGNSGNDTIFGDEGRDRLFGGQGNDQLVGGLGNDRLWGDVGTDTLTGGEGEDAFVLSPGTGGLTPNLADIITDFEPTFDRIELTDFLTFSQLNLIQGVEGTQIQLQSTGEYLGIVLNVNPADLAASSFI